MTDKRFLRPEVAGEPLCNQWYAWSYLLAPATAPLFVQNLHVPLMQAFLEAPNLHAIGPRGGPQLEVPASRVVAVRALLEQTLGEQAEALRFAAALADLDRVLAAVPAGMSLAASYARVPEMLRGYVELTYDLHSRPAVRLIERLLYRSEHHRTAPQSIALRALTGDARPHAFHAPRLADPEALALDVAFAAPELDRLFAARQTAVSVGELGEAMGVTRAQAGRFAALFCDAAPLPRPRFDRGGVRCRYFGHACVLLETRETSVLVDPVIAYPHAGATPRFGLADLPERIEYVVITQGRADHLMLESLLALRHRIGTIVVPRGGGTLEDPSLRLMLRHAGFPRVVELDELETLELPGGGLTGIPFLGAHGDLAIRGKLAHRVALAGWSFVLAAEASGVEPRVYDHVAAALGDTDVLFLGMASETAPMTRTYGPLLPSPLPRMADASRRLDAANCERATEIIDRLRPRSVYVYAMGREPWLRHVMPPGHDEASHALDEARELIAHCRAYGITAELPFGRAEYVFPPR